MQKFILINKKIQQQPNKAQSDKGETTAGKQIAGIQPEIQPKHCTIRTTATPAKIHTHTH